MKHFLIIVLGMCVVTYLPRWLPLALLSKVDLPDWARNWLEFVPAAILCALVMPSLVLDASGSHVSLLNTRLLVAIPTFVLAIKTRSLALTLIAGMVMYWLTGLF